MKTKEKIAADVSNGNHRVDQYVTSYFNLERKQFEINQGVPQSKVNFLQLSQMEEKDGFSTKLLIVCHSTDDGMLMICKEKYSLLQFAIPCGSSLSFLKIPRSGGGVGGEPGRFTLLYYYHHINYKIFSLLIRVLILI